MRARRLGKFSARAVAMTLMMVMASAAMVSTGMVDLSEAVAQQRERRIVMMNVPRGGTKVLLRTLKELPEVKLHSQKWLKGQADEFGVDTDGLFGRTSDLTLLMEQADVVLILALIYRKDEQIYEVKMFLPSEEEPERSFEIPGSRKGLREEGAQQIKREVRAYLEEVDARQKAAQRDPEPDTAKDPEPEEEEVVNTNVLRERALKEETAQQKLLPKDWLRAAAFLRFTSRELLVGGLSGAVLSQSSTLYPGFQVQVEAFPFVFTGADATAVGVFLDYVQAFDTIAFEDQTGTKQEVSLSHKRFEGGLSYRIDTPRRAELTDEFIRARLRATVKWSDYTLEQNPALPSTSLTSLVLSGHIMYPVFVKGFSLVGGFEFVPFASWGKGQEIFGTSASTYGVGTLVGGQYMFTDKVGFTFDYSFRLNKTKFEGEGELAQPEADEDGMMSAPKGVAFKKATAFEQLQAIKFGIAYHY